MKKGQTVLGVIVFTIACLGRPTTAADKPPAPIRKIVIVTLVKDGVRAAEIEAGLKDAFTQHGIKADTLRTLFRTALSVREMIEQLRALGYDHLLCAAPRKSIQITPADHASKMFNMESCLTTYTTGNFSSGEPIDFSAMGAEQRTNPQGGAALLNSPIPTNPGSAPIRVVKGALRVFDIQADRLTWERSVEVKIPEQLHTRFQTKLIVDAAWDAIENAGILPPKS